MTRGVGKGWKGTAIERFWRKCVYDPTTGCVVWIGARTSRGYGLFWGGERGHAAHRWLWEHFNGPVPEGHQLDHLCRNTSCVNLTHVEPVTATENQLRGVGPTLSRLRAASRTHCGNGHPYDEKNTHFDKRGGRSCRACAAIDARNLRRRRAAERAAA